MTASYLLDVSSCRRLHQNLTRAWNSSESFSITLPNWTGVDSQERLLTYIGHNHLHNHCIWKMEDEARRVDSPNTIIANLKRCIDRENQLRNDTIEEIDHELSRRLESISVVTRHDAEMHSETPGAIIDRMSILSLRIHHMAVQAERRNVSDHHRNQCCWKCNVLREQLSQLTYCLDRLMRGIERGIIRLACSPRFKMYNDPTLNPALYLKK